jgi:hypothetical protein
VITTASTQPSGTSAITNVVKKKMVATPFASRRRSATRSNTATLTGFSRVSTFIR